MRIAVAPRMDSRNVQEDVLTNEYRMYGAGCVRYKGILEQAAEQLGSGFYLLPSSVHEVILFLSAEQEDCSTGMLRGMVFEINRSDAFDEKDVLSDDVYYFDMNKNELAIAGKKA